MVIPMSQKRKMIFLIFIIINLFLITWIVIHNNFDIEKVLKYSKELASVEFPGVSLFIAISVFDQFGLNKKITEKKVELIIELLTELKNQKGFGAHYEINGGLLSSRPFYFGESMAKNYIDRVTKLESNYLNFLNSRLKMDGNDYDEAFKKVKKVLNHPLMPNKIVEKAQFLKLSGGLKDIIDTEFVGVVYVCFTNEAKIKLIEGNREDWFFAENNKCTILEFLNKFDELFNVCEEWVSLHSNINEKLNLEEFH